MLLFCVILCYFMSAFSSFSPTMAMRASVISKSLEMNSTMRVPLVMSQWSSHCFSSSS